MHLFFRTRRVLLAACFLFFAGTGEMLLHAQSLSVPTDVQSPDHGHSVLMDLDRLEAEEGPEAAIEALSGVHPSDTLYEQVLLQHLELLLRHRPDDHDAQVALLQAGIALNGWEVYTFFITLPAVLASQERGEEALEAAEEAMRRYPMNALAARTKSIALLALDRKDEALSLLQDLARQFPYESTIHSDIAKYVSADGEYTRAAMAYAYALGLEMESSNSQQALVDMDNLLRGASPDYEENGFDFGRSAGRYADLDLLVKNRVSMDRDYKMKPKVTFAFARQFHFICSNLKQLPKQDGFWYDMYESVFRDFLDDDLFEGWMYMALASSQDPDVYQQAVKNKKKLLEFRSHFHDMVYSRYGQTEAEVDGKMVAVERVFNNDGSILGQGKSTPNEQPTGTWRYYHDNGVLAGVGAFDKAGERDGKWLMYDQRGVLRRKVHYAHGVESGPYVLYYPHGHRSDSVFLVDGTAEGTVLDFWKNGAPRYSKIKKDGEFNGPAKEFYRNGALHYAYQLVNDKLDGPAKGYMPNGQLEYIMNFKNGQRHGPQLEFYRTGDTTVVERFAEGKRDGAYRFFYDGGTLRQTGTAVDGVSVDTIRRYYIHGGLEEQMVFDSKGRKEGTHLTYSPQGHLYTVMEFKRDLLMAYTYYDAEGKVLISQERNKGRFDFVGYTSAGHRLVEGRYLDEGDKDGLWTYYYENGQKQSEETMDKGVRNGPSKTYYPNGQLKEKSHYSDGLLDGQYTRYYIDGALEAHGRFAEGERDGSSTTFHPDGETPKEIRYHIDGELEGYQYDFGVDGVLTARDQYLEGFLLEQCYYNAEGVEYECMRYPEGESTMRFMYANGAPFADLHLRYGVLDGPGTWYYPDGSIETTGENLNGKRHNEWVYYNPDGTESDRYHYNMGRLLDSVVHLDYHGNTSSVQRFYRGEEHGLYSEFFNNGKPSMHREKAFGEMHGTTTTFAYTGERQLVRYYDRSRLIGYSYEGSNGALVDTIFVDWSDAVLEPKYANGQTSRVMRYINGELHGAYKEFYPSGQEMESLDFVHGYRHGDAVEYFPDGSIRTEGQFHYGAREGSFSSYHAPGVLASEVTYRQGKLHGPAAFYGKDGTLMGRYQYRNGNLVDILNP